MTQMHLFLSYAREDRPIVERLVDDLRASGYFPYFDEQVAGGQKWWDELLSRIESSTAFMPIVGSSYLSSTPCQLESAYAEALHKPFLPVAVADVPPQLFSEAIASAQWVKYGEHNPNSIFSVIRAINSLGPPPKLPDPLPARPVVPISYMNELQNEVAGETEISKARQIVIIADLKGRLDTPDWEAAIFLLRQLRQRSDIGWQPAQDIDEILLRFGGAAPRPDPPDLGREGGLYKNVDGPKSPRPPHGAQLTPQPKERPNVVPNLPKPGHSTLWWIIVVCIVTFGVLIIMGAFRTW